MKNMEKQIEVKGLLLSDYSKLKEKAELNDIQAHEKVRELNKEINELKKNFEKGKFYAFEERHHEGWRIEQYFNENEIIRRILEHMDFLRRELYHYDSDARFQINARIRILENQLNEEREKYKKEIDNRNTFITALISILISCAAAFIITNSIN